MPDLVDQLFNVLKAQDMMIAVAESCTGGLMASTLTHKAGASVVFDRGFVTYTNQAKIDMLSVSALVLKQHGAVSSACAQMMAQGALGNSEGHIALSTTGIAGPDGGTDEKPVGLVFIGYALKDGRTGSFEHHFEGSRQSVQTQSVAMAINHALSILSDAQA